MSARLGNTWKPGPPSAGDQIAHIGVDLISAMGVDLLREFVFYHEDGVSRNESALFRPRCVNRLLASAVICTAAQW